MARSLNSICRARDEARYVSRTWSSTSEHVYQDQPERYMPPAEQTYGTIENRDRWYSIEVRDRKSGGRLFSPEVCHVANGVYNKAVGNTQFKHHFDLHSNPLDLIQYIDSTLYEVTYDHSILCR